MPSSEFHRLQPDTATARWFWTFRQSYRLAGFRLPLFVETADETAALRALEWIARQRLYPRLLWVSESPLPEHIANSVTQLPAGKYGTVLGSEFDGVVYDMHSGLHPDALAALSGVIRAGGAMILLGPALNQWRHFHDPDYQRILAYPLTAKDAQGLFLGYLADRIQHSSHWAQARVKDHRLQIHKSAMVPFPHRRENAHPEPTVDVTTREQQRLISKVMQIDPGKPAIVAVTAGRGRGKSAGLGMATRLWADQTGGNTWVTAPTKAALNSFFQFAGDCPNLSFYPPDDLLQKGRSLQPDQLPQLLVIDEAAAIPTGLLKSLTEIFPRIVFSTTTHGYEGTGQGFALKFFPTLDKLHPAWQWIKLEEPIRWHRDDPLEEFIDDCFMLQGSPLESGETAPDKVRLQALQMRCHSPEVLLEDREHLRKLVHLLTIAHYRTTPDDLRVILDSPGIQSFTVWQQNHLVAAALISLEKPFTETPLVEAIWQGRRRPRGHLLQQSLAQQLGVREGLTQPMARIIRIAAHPRLQQQGIGSWLLQQLQKHFSEQVTLLGASFAGEPEVVGFWQANGYQLVRLGNKRDHVSGTYAALVLKAIGENGQALAKQARQRFLTRTGYDFHCHKYPGDLLQVLIQGGPAASRRQAGNSWSTRRKPSPEERDQLQLFAEGARQFESVEDLLVRVSPISGYKALKLLKKAANRGIAPDLSEIARALQLTGRKQLVAQLRQEAQQWLQAQSDPTRPNAAGPI